MSPAQRSSMSDDGSEAPPPYEVVYEAGPGGDEEEHDEDEGESHEYLVRDGVATATFPDGSTYHGPYVNGKRNGRGVYTFARGGKYDGDYVDGERHGEGEMTYPDGGRYRGQFEHNARSGRGVYYYPNGDRFAGQWERDEKNGDGAYVDGRSHTTLRGTWRDGVVTGGKLVAHDGTVWEGDFSANRPLGDGRFVFPTGVELSGSFTRGGRFVHAQ